MKGSARATPVKGRGGPRQGSGGQIAALHGSSKEHQDSDEESVDEDSGSGNGTNEEQVSAEEEETSPEPESEPVKKPKAKSLAKAVSPVKIDKIHWRKWVPTGKFDGKLLTYYCTKYSSK